MVREVLYADRITKFKMSMSWHLAISHRPVALRHADHVPVLEGAESCEKIGTPAGAGAPIGDERTHCYGANRQLVRTRRLELRCLLRGCYVKLVAVADPPGDVHVNIRRTRQLLRRRCRQEGCWSTFPPTGVSVSNRTPPQRTKPGSDSPTCAIWRNYSPVCDRYSMVRLIRRHRYDD